MTEQQLFKGIGLLRITEGSKFRLLKIPKVTNGDSFEVAPFPFLPDPQTSLDVYPEAGLIVTQDTLMTIDGKIILNHENAHFEVELVSDKWMIIEDMKLDNDIRYRITFWDGEKESGYICGRKILRSEKYFAVYTAHDSVWRVYTYDRRKVLELEHTEKDMHLKGDFFLFEGVGHYVAYTLASKESSAEEKCVFNHQQLILCSIYMEFALCSDIRGNIRTYHQGKYTDFGKVEEVDLYDKAGIFVIRRNGRYFLYKFNGDVFADNICPYGADKVAYNQDDNTLLIGVNSVFHLVKV